MKAIIYSRVSNSNQSTQRQINELKDIPGFEVVKVFTESISGYTQSAYSRPELQRAIKYATDNGIHVIMIHEISRLGRRTAEVLNIIEDLKKQGIKIYIKSLGITINGNSNSEAINKLIITIMADLARMESEQLSYRIKSGLQERKRKGYTIGRKLGATETTDVFLNKYKDVIKYLKRGESIRWTANQTGKSIATVFKVKSKLS